VRIDPDRTKYRRRAPATSGLAGRFCNSFNFTIGYRRLFCRLEKKRRSQRAHGCARKVAVATLIGISIGNGPVPASAGA
jgi:hypothetical protein